MPRSLALSLHSTLCTHKHTGLEFSQAAGALLLVALSHFHCTTALPCPRYCPTCSWYSRGERSLLHARCQGQQHLRLQPQFESSSVHHERLRSHAESESQRSSVLMLVPTKSIMLEKLSPGKKSAFQCMKSGGCT